MNKLQKGIAAAGIALTTLTGASLLSVTSAQADGLVTACAAAGKVLDVKTGSQCISGKIRFERGGYVSAQVGNINISKRISSATGRPSWEDAFNTGASIAAAFLREGGKHGVVWTEFQMGTQISGGRCTGSWAQYCGTAGIVEGNGRKPAGVHYNNRAGGIFKSAITDMWERISAPRTAVNTNTRTQTQVVTGGGAVVRQPQTTTVQGGGTVTTTQTCSVDRNGCFNVQIRLGQ